MNAALLQVILAITMFITTAVAGFIPIKVVRILDKNTGKGGNGNKWLSLLSCFSGGVFLATCFLDIIPHTNENYARFISDSGIENEFPLTQFFICVGFFLVYLIEEVCMKVFSMSHDHSHGHSHSEPSKNNNNQGSLHRKESLNLRNTESALLGYNGKEEKDRAATIHSMVMEETANYAVAEKSEGSLLKSLTFAVAMSFHSILEGFALGVQDTTSRIVTLFASLILHKGIEAFSVGLQISKGNHDKMKAVILTILVYALMTPLGSALGTLLQMSNMNPIVKDGAVVILESLAAGTFIYVTFLEVLAHEKNNEYDSLTQLLAIFIGFALIATLQFTFGGHGHGSEDHDGHMHSASLMTTLMPSH